MPEKQITVKVVQTKDLKVGDSPMKLYTGEYMLKVPEGYYIEVCMKKLKDFSELLTEDEDLPEHF